MYSRELKVEFDDSYVYIILICIPSLKNDIIFYFYLNLRCYCNQSNYEKKKTNKAKQKLVRLIQPFKASGKIFLRAFFTLFLL